MADPNTWQPPTQGAGVTDVVTQLQGIVSQLTQLVKAIKGRVTSGTLTLAAASSTVIPQPAVQSLSTISLSPTNAAAASNPVFISAIVAGTSFTVTTASGSPPSGTPTFAYTINTPT